MWFGPWGSPRASARPGQMSREFLPRIGLRVYGRPKEVILSRRQGVPRFGILLGVLAAAAGACCASPGMASAQAPAQDSVVLTSGPAQAGSYLGIEINATSGPSGENPTGQIRANAFGLIQLGGPVFCLAVSGNTATINFEDRIGGFGILTVQVVDGQPDTFDAVPAGRAPTDCSPLPPSGLGGPVIGGDITVVDAPAVPTLKDQCTNGGWRNYGATFKNQGQCVAFVQRGPKP
jgi:hypothetical protein